MPLLCPSTTTHRVTAHRLNKCFLEGRRWHSGDPVPTFRVSLRGGMVLPSNKPPASPSLEGTLECRQALDRIHPLPQQDMLLLSELTLLPQLRLALLDGGHHHIAHASRRQPVQTSLDPLDGDDVQVLSTYGEKCWH